MQYYYACYIAMDIITQLLQSDSLSAFDMPYFLITFDVKESFENVMIEVI